ncbi:MAG TPA: hypothetical protein VK531_15345 [Gemmatimonadales bacterium]|jgi:hypothetical protein|nr:hypothetical protein [Gemmatimonadales bacterium]
MRRHSMHPRTWSVPLVLVLVMNSCGELAGPGGYTVTYRANLAGIATIDSIYYGNGSEQCTSNCTADSTMQRVVAPATPATNPSWVVILSNVSPGALLEVHLFGSGTNAGTAQLVRLWMTAEGALSGDSVSATTATGAKFTEDLAPRRL